ncbi:MAG: DUF4190 domain-containing protein, partial [Lachnospiraceae bacterium]
TYDKETKAALGHDLTDAEHFEDETGYYLICNRCSEKILDTTIFSATFLNGDKTVKTVGYLKYGQYLTADQLPAEPTKAFGIAAMILGIISLVLFCTCINIPLAIAAIVLAIVQLVKGGKKGMAVAGLVTGAASIVCFVIFWVLISIGVIDESLTYSYDIPYYEWEEEFEDNFYDTFDL